MPSTRRSISLLALAMTIASVVWLGPGGAAADDPAPVEIAEAPALTWGFKQSWRTYVGAPQVAGGAALTAGAGASDPYGIAWEFDSGSFDAATGTTRLEYRGTAHWQKYYLPDNPALADPPPGYAGPLDIHRLDVKMSDPVVTIGPDSATISVAAVSRQLDSWELVNLGRVDVVNLDVAGIDPVVDGGVTTWTGIPAFTSEGANPVFAGNYPAGRAIDPLSFSYTGPGDAPDFSEDWTLPGSTKLGLTQNQIITTTGLDSQYSPWWIDRGRRLVHYRSGAVVGGQVLWTYRAFSLDTMAEVGEPLVLPEAERVGQTSLFDTTGGRVFYAQPGSEPFVARWLQFDTAQGKYVRGAPAAPFPLAGSAGALFWDAVGKRAFNVQRVVPVGVPNNAYDQHQWRLHAYSEQPDQTWTRESYDLPNFPLGLNQRGYPDAGNGLDAPLGVAASDGSLILLGTRQTSNDPSVTPPATVPGAWRIQLAGGQATVTAIPGTEVDNNSSATFDALRPGPGGQVTLFRIGSLSSGIPHLVQTLTVSEGGPVAVGPRTDAGTIDVSTVDALAVDPEDGMAWIGSNRQQRLVGVKDGRVVADQFSAERHPRGGPVVAGAGHAVHPQTSDGVPAPTGGSPIFGFGRFDRLGWSPEVSADPQPGAVELAAGETAEQVQFQSTATATATPAPTRQWQVKAPGGLRFVNLQGETGETLTIDAERTMGGSEYRAVYSNTAGRIASDPATLTVDYAPEIAVDVTDVEAVEGEPAVFQVLSQGSPEPDVEWQRRVGGFWQPVEDDDNFDVGSGTLTVKETNVDQSGALFRARVVNSVAATYSRAAKLTVEPAIKIPPGGLSLDGVSLDWTGSPELQRLAPSGQSNYLSAGASDGSESTYRASAPGARVLHVAPNGQESPASWATRSAQTAGVVKQVVRLTDGRAEIEEDGSASVTWPGSFSVNFYGGLVPFTVSSPELTIDADGDGTLRGDLSGYGASQADPNDRHSIAPVADVTIATFSGVEVDPQGKVTIEADYAGVEVAPPAGFGPQTGRLPAGVRGRRRSSTSTAPPDWLPTGTRPAAYSTTTSRLTRSASTSPARAASRRWSTMATCSRRRRQPSPGRRLRA
jgi:hypothetical protein